MDQKRQLHNQRQRTGFKWAYQRVLRNSSCKSIKVSNSQVILLCCIILLVTLTNAQQIIYDNYIQSQYPKGNNVLDSEQQQCLIGFQTVKQTKNPNSLFSPTAAITELTHKDAMKVQQYNKWKYCIIRSKQQLSKSQPTYFSTDWEQCKQKCCAIISQDQCYFKASFINRQPFNQFNLYPNIRRVLIQNDNKDTSSNAKNTAEQRKSTTVDRIDGMDEMDKSVILQEDNTNGSGTVANGGQIVLIIISCIFGVPLLLLIVFAIISIVKLCRLRSRSNSPNVNNAQQQGTQNMIAEEINLDEYKMDEMGPYHVNFQQQCSICLDEKVNIRTKCGHLYHPQCIKAWIMKGKNRCPVCNCTRLNPMKVYCKKCYVGVRLIVLEYRTTDQIVGEMGLLECENCGSEDISAAFSPTLKTPQPKTSNQNKDEPEIKKKPAAGVSESVQQNQQPQFKIESHNVSIEYVSSSSSSQQSSQQPDNIPHLNNIVEGEHNQNQLIQSLAIRASTDQLRPSSSR